MSLGRAAAARPCATRYPPLAGSWAPPVVAVDCVLFVAGAGVVVEVEVAAPPAGGTVAAVPVEPVEGVPVVVPPVEVAPVMVAPVVVPPVEVAPVVVAPVVVALVEVAPAVPAAVAPVPAGVPTA